jgi:hypothetical protein
MGIIDTWKSFLNRKTDYTETKSLRLLMRKGPKETPWEEFSDRHRQALLRLCVLAGGAAGLLFTYVIYTMFNSINFPH